MECPWSQRVSQLIDEELSPNETAETRIHLSACEHCRQAYDDFVQLQRELRGHNFQMDPSARKRVLRKAFASSAPPFWKRSVMLPVPVMGLILLAVVALGLWLALRRPQTPGFPTVRMIPSQKEAETFDLTRFDHGKRATIEKVKQTETSQGTMK
jgi:anti-sigma factor RsiW